MTRQTDLPSHVRAIVDEIETEIGEEPWRPAALIEGEGGEAHLRDGHGRRRSSVVSVSRYPSAASVIRRQDAHIALSDGVDAGIPKATLSRTGSTFSPCARSRNIRRSCQARWPTIHEIEFIGSSRRMPSSSRSPRRPRTHSARVNRNSSTRGWAIAGEPSSRSSPNVSCSAYHPPTMSSPPELPSHVRAIVDEIETEIGDVPGDAERLIQGAGRHEGNGRVEAAVHQIGRAHV